MEESANLREFIEAAGRSLSKAQRLLLEQEPPAGETVMAVSEVELEIKATLEGTGDDMQLMPVSRKDASADALAHEALSTLRVRYVALPGEALSPSDRAEAAREPREAGEINRE
ncbi:MAG TPA: hypothetical protein VFX35_10740 [Solirubrobacterales bacterium]|nr:hypothetical protein [Solirubrobacterales bacterium]